MLKDMLWPGSNEKMRQELLRARIRPMSSAAPGQITSAAEVTNVSRHGFWLLLGQEELFLPFSDFPWFQTAANGPRS